MGTKSIREALRGIYARGTADEVQQAQKAMAEVEQLRRAAVSLYAKVLIPPGPEEIPELTPLWGIAQEAAPILAQRTCPKCHAVSGGDWRQCNGVCPRPDSPHYVPEAVS